ncbi:non-SMC mitotic condensation complex subunit 1 [Boeremia exigua]|uniref:non-SMC mitotic condensation complex subunit 1 n=1 Tax=Boeremia exigua TaxID=749465 RepID=UPI001E8CD4D1|nr:non-SMC mitotic condensation complex subunit 1 [Boeremia exigua]KAH6644124.1 non-SMC mitotic condensation complex subunit 1 [Boeremia exigua]
MEARVDFDINEAIKLFDSDPSTIPTTEAPQALQECEEDPEALSSLSLINSELNPVVDAVAENPDAITYSSVFDTIQFLLKNSSQIPPTALGKILDLLVSALSAQADIVHVDLEAEEQDAIPHHKTILEMYAFLLRWTISAVETRALEKSASAPAARGRGKTGKSKTGSSKDGTWDAAAQLETALDRVSKVLKLKLGRIFVTTSERDTFIGLFTKPVYHILENEARVKNTAIRNHCFRVLCIAVKHHGHAYTAQTSINQCLTYFEHLSEPMAEFLHTLADAYDYSQLAEDVLKDISTKEYSATDLKGPKSVSIFLIKISELLPNLIVRQGALLNNLLDSEAYTLRCAMIEVCGNIINMLSKLSQDDRSDAHKRNMDIFFEVLEQRFLDINPYCRCRVMQVYVKLCDLPHMSSKQARKRRQMAADYAEQSLKDKSSNVRRNAIKLLSKLVETHLFADMYGGLLSTEIWEQGLESIEASIAALKPPAEELQERTPGEIDESMLIDATQADVGVAKDPGEMSAEEHNAAAAKVAKDRETVQELEKFNKVRSFVRQALRFIEVINDAAEQVMQLLSSKNKSEVIEAMDFFTKIDAYKIANARLGIKRMLRLIWTKGNSDEGKGVQAHLIDCYKDLFFNAPPGCDANQAANYITRGMISLTFDTTPADLISLEQLLSTMMKQGLVNSLVIEKLWGIYGYQKKDISVRQRRGAIIVLGMLALSSPDIIVQEMEACLKIGLGKLGRRDFGLARYTCVALRRISAASGKLQAGEAPAPSVKLPNDHAVLIRLAAMCEMESDNKEWFGVADQAISAIYVLSKHPDVLCSEIIRQVAKRVFAPKAPSRPNTSSGQKSDDFEPMDVDGGEEMPDAPVNEVPNPKKQNSALALSQLLFIVGHVAIKQIVHLELCELEFKRRKAEKEKDKKTAPRKSLAPEPTPMKKGRKRGALKDPTPAPDPEADDLDLMAGTNEDDFTDAIAHVRERELLFGPQSLLANFGPLVSEICANNISYNHPTLQAQAALCLGKLMCVSQEYCESNLDLLLNILERSQDAIVRSNLVIALGDMAVCFNHLVEQDTEFLYRRLDDNDQSVKRTCLQTLTFLILAGQVKVKGQLAEMAKCIEDRDKKIAEMARQFFSELSTKDNAIYNQFVDMFSTLSADNGLSEDAFKRIIKYLAGYIEKEKQAKQLANKLAARLPRAESERQWRDVEYTLGFLQHKDEDIQKMLSEGFKVVQASG